ncbi:gliding motility-associated C-terminal domain-containing protein [Microvirga sp. STR05]|uniref:Gliding motility-associated C-terminal domain-containing protein n=1 Tax=Hymenobacter duratus TaxID=2771356 RepID=A0ABR8JL92_9BACT|nr:gliding motility-associated C-terminal domain-containing protein [Hymenobacter duratus]MBD2716358.1 gliding motility-associated C-terminal domain-containing protein [Hymenobacter duratus]MBR7951273.1 gliding motility-associated C-terminal domain-containing protein [Microvirga sp. STR05]
MSLRGGSGDVSSSFRRQVFRLKCAPVLAAVRHQNGRDYWVITHDAGASRYRVYPVTAAGLGSMPVVSAGGSSPLYQIPPSGDLGLDDSYLRASPDGRRLTFLPRGGKDINGVALFNLLDFDAATGRVSNPVTVTGRGGTYCAFSPDGTKLYTSAGDPDTVAGYANQFVQYNLRAGSAAAIAASAQELLPNDIFFQPNDMELGPDGRLYIASGTDSMAFVRYPNRAGAACELVPRGIWMGPPLPPPVGTGRGSTNVPHFLSSYLYLADFTTAAVCVGDSARFRLRYASRLDSVRWRFQDPAVPGGGTSTTRPAAAHRYAQPGTYRARVQVYYNDGATDTLSRLVTVRPIPTVALPAPPLLCPGQPLLLTPQLSPDVTSYRWSTGATTPTLTVVQPGAYSLTVTSGAGGCAATATVQVRAAPLPPDPLPGLPPDTLRCLDTPLTLRAPAGLAVRWPDGSTAPTYAVPPGTPAVAVLLTTAQGCPITRTVRVQETECADQLVLPNIITPNGDGKNDGLQIPGLQPGVWTLRVFSRWGRLVYEQADYVSGQWKAQGLPDGLYYYLLARPGQPPRKGWVEVMR